MVYIWFGYHSCHCLLDISFSKLIKRVLIPNSFEIEVRTSKVVLEKPQASCVCYTSGPSLVMFVVWKRKIRRRCKFIDVSNVVRSIHSAKHASHAMDHDSSFVCKLIRMRGWGDPVSKEYNPLKSWDSPDHPPEVPHCKWTKLDFRIIDFSHYQLATGRKYGDHSLESCDGLSRQLKVRQRSAVIYL
jgi:hypothetical protein